MADKIWLKRVLIPLWVIQLIICVIYLGVSAVGLWAVDEAEYQGYLDDDKYDAAINALNIGAAISLSFAAFTIIMDIVEIILAAMHKLKPVPNIVMQSIKSLIWTVYFIISIIGAASGTASGLSIFLILVLFLTCIGQLIYGAVIVHRHRKGTLYRGNYSPFNAEGGHGPAFGYTGAYNAPAQGGGYTAYNPPAQTGYSQPGFKPAGASGDYYGGQGSYEMHGSTTRY